MNGLRALQAAPLRRASLNLRRFSFTPARGFADPELIIEKGKSMMSSKGLSTTGNEMHRTIYEVQRERGAGRGPSATEEYLGLDRARLAAFAHALDGPSYTGENFSGTVTINQVFYLGQRRLTTELIDVIDERVAFRVLNELTLPRADQLGVSVEKLQEETNRLARLGF